MELPAVSFSWGTGLEQVGGSVDYGVVFMVVVAAVAAGNGVILPRQCLWEWQMWEVAFPAGGAVSGCFPAPEVLESVLRGSEALLGHPEQNLRVF